MNGVTPEWPPHEVIANPLVAAVRRDREFALERDRPPTLCGATLAGDRSTRFDRSPSR